MSRITAAGPAPKRPPHSELDVSLRVVIGVVLALGFAACGDKGKAPEPQASEGRSAAREKLGIVDRSHAGEPAPAIVFERAPDTKTSLADFKGRPVLVNLWATWCVPCLAEMPALDALAQREGTALTIVPISQDLEGWPAVSKFFAPGKFVALKPYLDQPGNYAQKLDAKGLPLSILYGPDGRERWRVNGPLDWTSPAVAAALG